MSTSTKICLRFSVFGNEYYFTPHFALATFLLLIICINLGMWQLARAEEKREVLALYTQHSKAKPISLHTMATPHLDYRYYPIELHGSFDNAHTFLVDNRIHNGEIGYDIITPFKADHEPTAILVNRRLDTSRPCALELTHTALYHASCYVDGYLNATIGLFLARLSL